MICIDIFIVDTYFSIVASMEKWSGGLILQFTDDASGARGASERRLPCTSCVSLTTDGGTVAGSSENMEHYTEQGTELLNSTVGVEDGTVIADSIAVLQDIVARL
jgi:hypothetical protein